jgi:hypothetical protein
VRLRSWMGHGSSGRSQGNATSSARRGPRPTLASVRVRPYRGAAATPAGVPNPSREVTPHVQVDHPGSGRRRDLACRDANPKARPGPVRRGSAAAIHMNPMIALHVSRTRRSSGSTCPGRRRRGVVTPARPTPRRSRLRRSSPQETMGYTMADYVFHSAMEGGVDGRCRSSRSSWRPCTPTAPPRGRIRSW